MGCLELLKERKIIIINNNLRGVLKDFNLVITFYYWILFFFLILGADEDETAYGEEAQSTSTKVQKDLSQWQERHAILILSTVKVWFQLFLPIALAPEYVEIETTK